MQAWPWGDLEYYYIYLEAPDRCGAFRHAIAAKWFFLGGTEASV
jgi:hypothetical protein